MLGEALPVFAVTDCEQGGVPPAEATSLAEDRHQLREIDGAEAWRRGEILAQVAAAVHETVTVDAVTDAKHMQDLVGGSLARPQEHLAVKTRCYFAEQPQRGPRG